jgi:peroxiredoxin Q/BCP
MKSAVRSALFGVALGFVATQPAAAAALEVGASAPAFSLPGSDGQTHSLEQPRGKRPVVLAWFPKAFTPG